MKNIVFCNLESKVITQEDIEYEQARQEWNRSIQKYPIAIVYCENTSDVVEAILYAKKLFIPIRIRSGGHNYEGYSTGNQVVVIDISKINNANINYIENTVTVGGGINNSQLYNYISKQGYPFPGGTCPTVGVGGYALGGGWGYSSRKFGLGCDSLLEIELVDYKGNILKANKNINKDLFWALKGAGGGNFGVVVYMKFKLPPKVDKVTYVQMYYPNASKEIQYEFLNTWQTWIDEADENINLNGGLYNTIDDGVYDYARGISYKNIEETQKFLEPFYNIQGAKIYLKYELFLEVVNFPLLQLINYKFDYYGENSCRLRKVKEKYDPYNIFNFHQSIK